MPAAKFMLISAATPAEVATAAVAGAGVLVALGLAVVPPAWRRHHRPRLRLTFGGEPPLLVLEPSATAPQVHVMRARVTNVGKRAATHVRAQTTGLWFRPNHPLPGGVEWTTLVDLPISHAWMSRTHDISSASEMVDLAPHMFDHVTIVSKGMLDTYTQALDGKGVEEINSRLGERLYQIGEYCVGIAAFSDDTEPVVAYRYYRISTSARQFIFGETAEQPPLVRPPVYGDLAAEFKGNEPLL